MPGPTRRLLPRGRILARLAVVGATLAILASAVGSVSAASPSKSLGHQSTAKITRLGTGHIGPRTGGVGRACLPAQRGQWRAAADGAEACGLAGSHQHRTR